MGVRMNKVFLVVQGRNRRYISVRQSKCHRQGTGGPAACHESFGQEGASVDGLDAGEEAGMPSCLGIEGSTDTRSFQAQGVFNFVVRQVDASMLPAMVRPRV